MAVLTHLETDTGTNVDISGATAVGAYTANGDKLIMVDVSIDAVAGNGDYVMYVTRQIGGSGSAYRILPQTTMAAASGLTAISGQSGWITVRNGDVLTCYVDGLAGDTSTPDWTTRWFESAVTLVTLADDAITASKFDESTAYPLKSADTGSTQVARVGADSDTLETLSDEIAAVKAETALIVADTGELQTDLVNGGRLDLLIDSIITHLTDIKGAGWTNETLAKIVVDIAAISAGSGATAQEVWEYATRVLTAGTNLPTANDISNAVWTQSDVYAVDEKGYQLETLYNDLINGGRLDLLLDAIKAKSDLIPASPAEAGEYTAAIGAIPTAPLLAANYTAPDNAGIAAVKAKTDNLPADPADDSDIDAQLAAIKSVIDNIHDTDLPAVKAETALIVEDTGTTLPATLATIAGYTDGIAGDVWSYAKRTLTHPSVSAEEPEDSNTLILYRDADIAIELTDLTIPAGAKKYIFTIKDNLDSGDDQAVLQASYAIDGSEVETNTLVYINSAVPPALTNPVTFTLTETNITIDLTAEAAALLPRYERGYLNWDLKLVTDAAVTIVLQGLAQIIGTSTRAIE